MASGMSLTCGFTFVSQNITNNTTTAKFWVDMVSWGNSYNALGMSSSRTFSGNLSGTASWTSTINKNQTKRIREETVTITHNANGTASVSASASVVTQTSNGTIYASTTYTPPTIARASSPSCSTNSPTLGTAFTINTNRASSSFTHTLKYRFNNGGNTGTIATGVGASCSYTPPLSFASSVTTASSFNFAVICETYSGSTLIGTKEIVVTMNIPTSVKPSISSVTIADAKGYTAYASGYVVGRSTPKVTVAASGSYSSTIKSYSITCEGVNKTGTANNQTFGAVATAGTRTVSVTVTDSRGRTATSSKTFTAVANSVFALTSSSYVKRWNTSTNTEDDESTTVRVNIGLTWSAFSAKNIATIDIDYKTETATTWTAIVNATTNSTGSYTYTANRTGYSNSTAYIFRIMATDKLGNTFTANYKVETAKPVLDFKGDGTGLGIGKVSSLANTLDINYEVKFNKEKYYAGGGGISGTSGYLKIATLNNSGRTYSNSGVELVVTQRQNVPSRVGIVLVSNSTAGSATVSTAYSFGRGNFWYVASGSTVEIWVQKVESYDHICLSDVISNPLYTSGPTIDVTQEFSASLPSGAVAIPTWFEPQTATNNRPMISNHIALKNAIYLQAQTSSGSFSNILGMNSSNQVELNWTSGGLKGRVMKKIWSGTLSAGGSATIPELPYYNVFGVKGQNVDPMALCFRTVANSNADKKTYIGGVGESPRGYDADGVSYVWSVAFQLTNSTTIKLTSAWVMNYWDKWSDNRVVTEIYGIL